MPQSPHGNCDARGTFIPSAMRFNERGGSAECGWAYGADGSYPRRDRNCGDRARDRCVLAKRQMRSPERVVCRAFSRRFKVQDPNPLETVRRCGVCNDPRDPVRDFKPDKRVVSDGQAVLADFGISLLKSDDHTHTRLTPARAISAIESTAA